MNIDYYLSRQNSEELYKYLVYEYKLNLDWQYVVADSDLEVRSLTNSIVLFKIANLKNNYWFGYINDIICVYDGLNYYFNGDANIIDKEPIKTFKTNKSFLMNLNLL